MVTRDERPIAHRDPGGIHASSGTRYVPVRAQPYWDTLEPLVTAVVSDAARRLDRDPRVLYPPATAFALWAWQSQGMAVDAPKMFRRNNVEQFVHLGMTDYTRGSRATYRSVLLAIVQAITPDSERQVPIPRSEPTPPYSRDEIAALRSWAKQQGNAGRRRDALVLLALGLGAGLATRELLTVRTSDLDLRGDDLQIVVWHETRPRVVPVRSLWAPTLVDAMKGDDRDRWLFRPTRQGVRGAQVTDFLHRGHLTDLDVRPSRMRTTWLLAHLIDGTAPRELLRISGLENHAALDRITRFLPSARTPLPAS